MGCMYIRAKVLCGKLSLFPPVNKKRIQIFSTDGRRGEDQGIKEQRDCVHCFCKFIVNQEKEESLIPFVSGPNLCNHTKKKHICYLVQK